MSGPKFAEELRKRYPTLSETTKLIALSAISECIFKEEEYSNLFDSFIEKPVPKDKLEELFK